MKNAIFHMEANYRSFVRHKLQVKIIPILIWRLKRKPVVLILLDLRLC